MARITILGAGNALANTPQKKSHPKFLTPAPSITGLATATILRSRGHTVTIIARDLPPANATPIDLATASTAWASPWAGAFYMPDVGAAPACQAMQRAALPHLLALADRHPASSARRVPIEDVRDDGVALADVWYRDAVPGFEVMRPDELPAGATLGMRWASVVVAPCVLLPWLRARLEGEGVRFVRREVGGLADVAGEGHDVLVNATGVGARALAGDAGVAAVRGQTHVVRTWWEKIFMRQGRQYTYCIPRLDGTAVLGGVKGYGSEDPGVSEEQRTDIFNRVGDNLPHVFAAFPADFEVVRDNVGFRPGREGGPRVEKEVIGGEKVVHAYGLSGSGYGYSFGLGEAVSDLVDEFLSSSPEAKL